MPQMHGEYVPVSTNPSSPKPVVDIFRELRRSKGGATGPVSSAAATAAGAAGDVAVEATGAGDRLIDVARSVAPSGIGSIGGSAGFAALVMAGGEDMRRKSMLNPPRYRSK